MKKHLFLLIVLIFLIEGCAGIEITQITSENPYKEGIRFFRPWPYLLVSKAKDGGGLESKIIYLPNKSEEYTIKVKSGIGSVETKFALEDGWKLTEFGETRDSKTAETITALTGSLKELMLTLGTEGKKEFHQGLYEFIFDDKTGLISGLKPVIQFE